MRLLRKVLLSVAGTVVLLVFVGFCWLYFYTRDLPDISAVAKYAPTSVTKVSDLCIGNSSTAIPYESIGSNVRNAIGAVETSETDPGVLRALWMDLFDKGGYAGIGGSRRRTLNASIYIARSLCYPPAKQLNRDIAELRTALQLERRYSRKQLFTAFSNRLHFGPNLIGVHDASAFYFHKPPAELTIAEGSLLVALMYSPTMYSPINRPDQALRRRNQIIDTMAVNGTITLADSQSAKSAPLGVAPASTAAH